MAIDLTTAKYDVAKIYIAAFNRVPDAGGLEFWSSAYMNGTSLSTIANGFTSSQEYANTYASNLTNSEYVSKIYKNVFARDVDASGNAFWVGALNNGAVTKAGLLNELVNAAMANGSNDGARLTNQATFGIYCATNNIPYTSVTTQLGSITSDAASIETAKSTINIVISNAVTISSSGSQTDSSGVNTTYTISSGDYTHSISGFGSGDKLIFPTDGVLTLLNTNYTDGVATLQCVYGGKTSYISLTGLSVTNDALLTSTSAFNTVFGSSTITGGTGVATPTTASVSVAASGSNSDSSSVNTTYTFASGDYTYTISGFGSSDKLVFPTSSVLTLSNSSYTDGIVTLQSVYGGKTSYVSLTGLSAATDAMLTSASAFNTVFGSSTITGGTGTASATTASVSVTGAGSNSDSSSINTTYTVSAGEYTYVVSGFGAGDKIDFPTSNTPTVVNSSFTDGEVILQYAAGGTTTVVRLTGLSSTNDISLNSINDFNTVFGSGTIF